jgi:hypothetical protein
MRYLAIGFLFACLLTACGTPAATQPTIIPTTAPAALSAPPTAAPVADAPTTEVLATIQTDAPAEQPTAELATEAPTDEPTAAPEPTSAPEPTAAPQAAPASDLGAAPQGSDCPADHPIKGNVRDRNPNKGEKIYHLPGDNGYAQTKPEQCFVDSTEAEAAGFRAVKK